MASAVDLRLGVTATAVKEGERQRQRKKIPMRREFFSFANDGGES
jgi:hypothetical protein